MRDVIKRLRTLGFTARRCYFNDQYIGLEILSASGDKVHEGETVSEAWALTFLSTVDTFVKSG